MALGLVWALAACGSAAGAGAAAGGDAEGDAQLVAADTANAETVGDVAAEVAPGSDVAGVPDTPDSGPGKDLAIGGCPLTQPEFGKKVACTGSAQCTWGKECCCGHCDPAYVCTCDGQFWACFNTDACLDVVCGDATDATDAADVAGSDASIDTTLGAWTLFAISQGGFCAPGTDCTSTWNLSPDGTLAMLKGGKTSSGKLSGSDMAAVKAVLDGADFLAKMKNGFACGMPPTDIGVSFHYALSGVQYDKDVTGCALTGGPDGALVQSVSKVVMAY